MNKTHDPALTSWVASANTPETDFPIQNLPFGVFRRFGASFRMVTALPGSEIDLLKLAIFRDPFPGSSCYPICGDKDRDRK